MAGSSFFALLEDIATLMDDVATLTKVATEKTAGVLGDDLALNAQQVTGVTPDRELPVVWAVAKGSALNKAILVPAALALSAIAPWAIVPVLVLGGLYLCFEGFEKVAHRFLHSKDEDEAHRAELVQAVTDPGVDMVAFERAKIRGAIRTDFILSAEIMVISLKEVIDEPLVSRGIILAIVGVLITVVVYGVVALIVKMDDVGLKLAQRESPRSQRTGRALVAAMPKVLAWLAVIGTGAMLWVGGHIILVGFDELGWHWPYGQVHHLEEEVHHVGGLGGVLAWLVNTAISAVVGFVVGFAILSVVERLPFGKAGDAASAAH
ncbi:MAG: DUF808 domain-containing protein [Acidimicrobiales bacterium]|nr:DUF808 domain-containing protein [Acidimicrobiales bacterium]